eukprot:4456511-Amphidinium_carterae.1
MPYFTDPDNQTFVYTLYIEEVCWVATKNVPDAPVVCQWDIDRTSKSSHPIRFTSGNTVHADYCAFLVVSSCRTRGMGQITLSLFSAEGMRLGSADIKLDSIGNDENFKSQRVELCSAGGVIVELTLASASQARWTRDRP